MLQNVVRSKRNLLIKHHPREIGIDLKNCVHFTPTLWQRKQLGDFNNPSSPHILHSVDSLDFKSIIKNLPEDTHIIAASPFMNNALRFELSKLIPDPIVCDISHLHGYNCETSVVLREKFSLESIHTALIYSKAPLQLYKQLESYKNIARFDSWDFNYTGGLLIANEESSRNLQNIPNFDLVISMNIPSVKSLTYMMAKSTSKFIIVVDTEKEVATANALLKRFKQLY